MRLGQSFTPAFLKLLLKMLRYIYNICIYIYIYIQIFILMDLMDVGAWCVIFTKRLTELLSYENWFFSIFSDLWEKAT